MTTPDPRAQLEADPADAARERKQEIDRRVQTDPMARTVTTDPTMGVVTSAVLAPVLEYRTGPSGPLRMPAADECYARTVTATEHGFDVALWHPQWGGYASVAVVTFDRLMGDADGEPGCFTVHNFHDGQFPSDEPTSYQYCDATQLIEFGLDVLEAQVKHQLYHGDGLPTSLNEPTRKQLLDFADRLRVLAKDST